MTLDYDLPRALPDETQRAAMIARAEALVPALLERLPEAKAQRRVPDATIAELKDAGFFRAFQPARWGGLEMHPEIFFDVPDAAQQEVWGEDSSVLISSSYMPVGKVKRAEGGYILSGEWGFSSGVDHCDWAMLGAFAPGEDGQPNRQDLRTFLVPKAEFEVKDDWHVSGLQGTGSKSVVVREVFIPEHRTHRFADGFRQASPGHAENQAPLFRMPFGQLFVRTVASGKPSVVAMSAADTKWRPASRTSTCMV